MVLKAILFDIYGTLVDISTNESNWYAYLDLAKFLGYRGVDLSADEIRWFYFEKIDNQIKSSREKYPEIDVRKIWHDILVEHRNQKKYKLKLDHGTFLSDIVTLHRALTREKMRLYDSTYETLQQLKNSLKLGIVSDCQWDYAIPELKILEIHDLFNSIVISGTYGFRKPDSRLFNQCLSCLNVSSSDAIFVGNDLFRDINGAKLAGIKTVLFEDKKRPSENKLVEPDFKINRFSQLLPIIQKLQT